MFHIVFKGALVLGLFVGFASNAFADCTSPAATEGTLEWDDSLKQFEYCDGTNWSLVGGGGGSGGGAPTWAGYTTSNYNGNLGGIKGANDKCNADYAGSRAMTYDDLLKLGTNYPWTSNAWVMDGSYLTWVTSNTAVQMSKDGRSYYSQANSFTQCIGWSNATSSYRGPYAYIDGYMAFTGCNNAAIKLACVTD